MTSLFYCSEKIEEIQKKYSAKNTLLKNIGYFVVQLIFIKKLKVAVTRG